MAQGHQGIPDAREQYRRLEARVAELERRLARGGTVTAEENLRIVRGVVNADGTIAEGQGFTAAKTGAGAYTVTFDDAFPDVPAVDVTPESWGADAVPAAGSFTVTTFVTTTGTSTDRRFSFTATGPA